LTGLHLLIHPGDESSNVPIDVLDKAKRKPAAEAEGQRRANGTFEHGHQLSVGNRGGMATRIRRDFISHCLIVKLHEIDPKTERRRFMKGIENLVKQFERGDLTVIKFVTERFEGVLPIDLTISGPNGGPVKTITATMSAEEAAAVYAATLNPQRDNMIDVTPDSFGDGQPIIDMIPEETPANGHDPEGTS
jgi:hypothetical protein